MWFDKDVLDFENLGGEDFDFDNLTNIYLKLGWNDHLDICVKSIALSIVVES